MDCIWVNLKNVGPPFFKFISVYIKMSFEQLENHSQLLCGRDSENERLYKMVQNPPCWKASSLLFPHWDIKTKAN